MKKILILVSVLFFSVALKAQEGTLHLNTYGAYEFEDKVDGSSVYTIVQDGFEWGAGLEYFPSDKRSLELKYLHFSTKFPLYRPSGDLIVDANSDGRINYILFGGNNYFGKNPEAILFPYAGADVGLAFLHIDNTRLKFAWDVKLGVKISTKSFVSFKIETNIQSAFSAFGKDVYQLPDGIIVSNTSYAALFQFGITGAICFDITNL